LLLYSISVRTGLSFTCNDSAGSGAPDELLCEPGERQDEPTRHLALLRVSSGAEGTAGREHWPQRIAVYWCCAVRLPRWHDDLMPVRRAAVFGNVQIYKEMRLQLERR
jgi:hypothetical protein